MTSRKRLTKDSATNHPRSLMTPGQVTNLGRPMSHLETGLLGTLMLHPLAGEDLAWRSSCRQPRISRCREEGFFPQSGAKPARSWAQDEALKPEATQSATYSQAGDCLDAGGGAAGHASVWQGPGLSLWPWSGSGFETSVCMGVGEGVCSHNWVCVNVQV